MKELGLFREVKAETGLQICQQLLQRERNKLFEFSVDRTRGNGITL